MWQRFFFVIILLILNCSAYAITVIDDAGQSIVLSRPAKRIISLAPDLTEIIFAAGAGEKIVGIVQGSTYPPAVKTKPIVASYNSVDLEHVLQLQPDLIVAWSEGTLTQRLKKLGIPIYLSHQKKVIDIVETIKRFGQLAGTEKTANQAAAIFLKKYRQLKHHYSQQKKVTVFYQVWSQPLVTIAKNSWIQDVIELCGGENIFSHFTIAAPVVNVESVVVANPQVIFATTGQANWQKQWQVFSNMIAVKNKHLFSIEADKMERAGPRLLDGAEEICERIANART